jgi:hypothetical protein
MQNKVMKDQATTAKCQYCGKQFIGKKPNSALYRHIRNYFKKPADKRGNHPAEDSEDILKLKANKFRPPTKSSTEAAARKATRQRKYKITRKSKDKEKVRYRIDSLK